MARKAKSVKVDDLKAFANHLLALEDANMHGTDKPCINPQWRHGVCAMIEKVLHDSGNYRGFNYHEKYVAGVTDETRRFYY